MSAPLRVLEGGRPSEDPLAAARGCVFGLALALALAVVVVAVVVWVLA